MNFTKEERLVDKSKIKRKCIIFVIVVATLIAAVIAIRTTLFNQGYKEAEEKYEDKIKELEEENERLSDPIAQYEIASQQINIDIVNSKIKSIGELATLEYLYTDAGKFEDAAKLFGQDVPFTTKSFIVKWDGIIKAGVKVDEIEVELNDSNKEIVVHVPKAQILSHEIDEESIETLDENDSVFNRIKVEDVRNFDAGSKEAMEKRVIENGILEKARKNTEDIIRKIIGTDIEEELGYHITFSDD